MYSNISVLILSFSFIPEQNQLRFDLRDGSRLYIIYNDVNEYAYQLSFSYDPLDRIKFMQWIKSGLSQIHLTIFTLGLKKMDFIVQ